VGSLHKTRNNGPKEHHNEVDDRAAGAQSLEVGRASVASSYRVLLFLHRKGTFTNGNISKNVADMRGTTSTGITLVIFFDRIAVSYTALTQNAMPQ
jgi:hypothetical protein